jgi:BirA family biotin operon repressor/biotin-[acetyl-CoA-carboxylase] ligase
MRRIYFETTDSTNSRARALWLGSAGDAFESPTMPPSFEGGGFYEPLLVTAAEQTSGRGRHGRTWHSPRGGAWMSVAWPMVREPAWYAGVSLAAAAAVHRGILDVIKKRAALNGRLGSAVLIKWPNDLLISDRKIAGILCEQFTMPHGRQQNAPKAEALPNGVIIVGVGVNVSFDIEQLGPQADLRHPATTLAEATGVEIEVEPVIDSIADRLVESLKAFENEGVSKSLLLYLREHLAYVGELKIWSSPRGALTGRILGLDERGRLLLQTEHGLTACDVGELEHLAPGQ